MTKTTNYQLPKWEKTDRIQMKDFNDAMERIDAAVAAMPIVKLMDVTLTQAQTSVTLDFSNIDLTQYAELKIHIHSLGDNYKVLINNQSGSNDYRVAGSNHEYLFIGGYQDNDAHDAVLAISGMGTRFINAIMHTGCGTSSYPVLDSASTELYDAALTCININNCRSGYSLAAGSRFLVYGLKK